MYLVETIMKSELKNISTSKRNFYIRSWRSTTVRLVRDNVLE